MISIITTIFSMLLGLVFSYLAYNVVYLLYLAVVGRFSRRQQLPAPAEKQSRFAILIPAYKEDAVIIETARDALRQSYPSHLYDVIVIADSLKPATIDTLRSLPVQVIPVQFEVSTKARALNTAMRQLPDGYYDVALVLDADNLMAPNALEQFNRWIQAGYRAVQGHRMAKNADTPIAYLDAISEEINNHLFRRALASLGFSSALIGSGAAIDYTLFKDIMRPIDAIGGFDREVEYRLLGQRVRIAYAEEIHIIDEKVRQSSVFNNQRRRWLAAHWIYTVRYFVPGLRELMRGNYDYANKMVQSLLLPRVLLLGILTVLAMFSLFVPISPVPGAWVGLLGGMVLTMLLAFPRAYYTPKLLTSLLQLPVVFWMMFRLLFRLKGANRTFIHTPHEV